MTGALLTCTFVSLMLLPYTAQESDFRLTRRVAGADDVAVTASYKYAQRYHLYLQLRENYPGAEFVVAAQGTAAGPVLLLHAFAAAGPVCTSDMTPPLLAGEGAVPMTLAERAPDFAWDGGDPRGGSHRIRAGADSDRFLFLVYGSDIDVIGVDLLDLPVDQRCVNVR
jgi:hypothetical protein